MTISFLLMGKFNATVCIRIVSRIGTLLLSRQGAVAYKRKRCPGSGIAIATRTNEPGVPPTQPGMQCKYHEVCSEMPREGPYGQLREHLGEVFQNLASASNK
jgi:hypothetical protein